MATFFTGEKLSTPVLMNKKKSLRKRLQQRCFTAVDADIFRALDKENDDILAISANTHHAKKLLSNQ